MERGRPRHHRLDALRGHTRCRPRRSHSGAANLDWVDRLQQLRVNALAAFAADVDSGAFPDESRFVPIDDEELAAFLAELD